MRHRLTRLARWGRALILTGLESVSLVRPKHWDALRIAFSELRRPTPQEPTYDHLRSAIRWLKAAQDATTSGGCSWGYRARALVLTNERLGWQPGYPESSGQIAETFFRYGAKYGDPDAVERARRIADWEISVQLSDGGIQGGVVGDKPVESSTYNTGQVILCWVRAFEESGVEAYLAAAERAAAFLISSLDESGRFVSGYSRFCLPGPKAYEARTGWALVALGQVMGSPAHIDAGVRIGNFTVRCQRPNGWFAQNDLEINDAPLTHTIGYALDGLWQMGVALARREYLDAVVLALNHIQRQIQPDGFLPGRLDSEWHPTVAWNCLTGSCQLATVFLRAHARNPESAYRASAARLLGFVCATQRWGGRHEGSAHGIQGSYPFGGDYGQYSTLSWATKFYADAVMDYLAP